MKRIRTLELPHPLTERDILNAQKWVLSKGYHIIDTERCFDCVRITFKAW